MPTAALLSADRYPLSADHRPLSADRRPLSADRHPLSANRCLLSVILNNQIIFLYFVHVFL